MTRYKKDINGNYIISGHKYKHLEGQRAQVIHGTAYKTSGGLTKKDLIQNKNGRIVSKKKHFSAKKDKRLIKAGYGTKKGHFGAIRLPGFKSKSKSKSSRSRRHKRKMRGGGTAVVGYNHDMVPSQAFSSVPSNVTNFSNLTTYN
jgi:hypothetical protein